MKKNKLITMILAILFVLVHTTSFATVSTVSNLEVGSAFLMDASSGKVLYEFASTEKRYPASTTKIMTAILVIETCDLDTVVTVPYEAIHIIPSGYSTASLQGGEKVTIDQLLKLMMVHSANDAANVLAFQIDGSLEKFANRMNQKSQNLKLTNTHFTNPSGAHNNNHYTTAQDMGTLMQYCMKNLTFRKYAGLKSCSIPSTNRSGARNFTTTNELLIPDNPNFYPYAIAGKTGYTREAQNCLVSVSNKNGLEFISVVLLAGGSSTSNGSRFTSSKKLFDYEYGSYMMQKLREKGSVGTQIEIVNANEETKNLDLLLADDISALMKQNHTEQEILPQITLQNTPLAPIAEGQVLGTITYVVDGEPYMTQLVASHSVEVSKSWRLGVQIVLIIVVLFLLYLLLFPNRNRKRNKLY